MNYKLYRDVDVKDFDTETLKRVYAHGIIMDFYSFTRDNEDVYKSVQTELRDRGVNTSDNLLNW